MNRPKIAYVMSRFPKLSETFILREMIALEEAGWDIKVYPLILEHTEVMHAEVRPWLDKVVHFSWLSGDVLNSNLREFLRNPILYFMLWCQVLWENLPSPNFLVRAILLFPKTVHMAVDMEKNGITHIHAHYATHPALAAWLICKLKGIPYSITAHAHDIFVNQVMLASKLRDSSFIVTISEFNRRFMIRHVGAWVAEKIYVIHCGIDTRIYSTRARNPVNGLFRVVCIGSLQPYKGMRYLIEACAILKRRNIPIYCTIIGEGEERPALEALIRRSKLDEIVELTGAKPQNEVAQLLQDANCYAQPSVITPSGKMEGIPVALMEAMSSRLPVVASNISGIPELVRPSETGYLVNPADANSLADALEHVYCHPDEATKIADAGCELVRDEFEIHRNVAQLAGLLSGKLSHSISGS